MLFSITIATRSFSTANHAHWHLNTGHNCPQGMCFSFIVPPPSRNVVFCHHLPLWLAASGASWGRWWSVENWTVPSEMEQQKNDQLVMQKNWQRVNIVNGHGTHKHFYLDFICYWIVFSPISIPRNLSYNYYGNPLRCEPWSSITNTCFLDQFYPYALWTMISSVMWTKPESHPNTDYWNHDCWINCGNSLRRAPPLITVIPGRVFSWNTVKILKDLNAYYEHTFLDPSQ